jgi:hypothetical protein
MQALHVTIYALLYTSEANQTNTWATISIIDKRNDRNYDHSAIEVGKVYATPFSGKVKIFTVRGHTTTLGRSETCTRDI